MTNNSLTPEQFSALISGMIGAFNSEFNDYMTDYSTQPEEIVKMVISVINKSNDVDALSDFAFSVHFNLTEMMIADPKLARPMDRGIPELSEQMKKKLRDKLNDHIKNYTYQMLAEDDKQQIKQLYDQWLRQSHPLISTAPATYVPQLSQPSRQPATSASTIQPPRARQPESRQHTAPVATQSPENTILRQQTAIYNSWWQRLARPQQEILRRQFDNLSSLEKQTIAAELNLPANTDQRTKLIACYHNFYFNYLSIHYRNTEINLDNIIASHRERFQARVNREQEPLRPLSSAHSGFTPRLSRLERRNEFLEQRLHRLESHDYFMGDMLNYIFYRRIYMNYFMTGTREVHHYHHNATDRTERHRDEERNKKDTKSVVAAAITIFTLVALSVSSLIYAINKANKSLQNLARGRKQSRSLGRLAATIIGALITSGMLISLGIPATIITATGMSLSTAIASSIGLGFLLGTGLGAMTFKYTAQFVSWLHNSNEISPTNPEKYQLTTYQREFMAELGVNFNELNRLIKAIKNSKSQLGFARKFAWTESYSDNKLYNKILEQVKNGELLGNVKFNGEVYRLFHDQIALANEIRNNPAQDLVIRPETYYYRERQTSRAYERTPAPTNATANRAHTGFGWRSLTAALLPDTTAQPQEQHSRERVLVA